MSQAHDRIVLQSLDLTGAPLTALYSPHDADRSVEERYFKGWENTLAMRGRFPQGWRTVADNGLVVLEHITNKSDQGLTTGTSFWRDYTVEAQIRQLTSTATPGADDNYRSVGRTGIVFRYQDQRHYYYYCIEGYDKVVLYARDDDNYIPLDWFREPVCAAQYHDMRIIGEGRTLSCWFDGVRRFRAFDDRYQAGKCGIRSTTLARFSQISVWTTAAGERKATAAAQAFGQAERAVQERYPKPVLAREISLVPYKPCWVKFADLRGSGRPDLVLFPMPDKSAPARPIVAITQEGEEIWRAHLPTSRLNRLADIDGDGRAEIVAICFDQRLRILDGHTGQVRAEAPMPEAHPYCQPRGSLLDPLFGPYVANLRGTAQPSDVVLVDDRDGEGGHTVWAFDDHLQPLWRTTIDQPPYGHNIHCADVNGDGREEVMAGYVLLSSDGRPLWQVPGSPYGDVFQAARHVDLAAVGDFDGNPANGLEGFLCAGTEGLYLVEMNTGEVLAHHRVGHAQGGTVAKYRKDVSGLQMWCGCRWGNVGIRTLVSGNGEVLARMEPDAVGEGGWPINWYGDGEELYFNSSTPQALGLWDAFGHRAVLFPEGPGARAQTMAIDLLGDPRDEAVFITDDRIYVFTQEIQLSPGTRCYAPDRRPGVAPPIVSMPAWKVVV